MVDDLCYLKKIMAIIRENLFKNSRFYQISVVADTLTLRCAKCM